MMPQGARQSRRYLAEAAGLDIVGDLGGDEENGLAPCDRDDRTSIVAQASMTQVQASRFGFQIL
jgi:hypothetical protein